VERHPKKVVHGIVIIIIIIIIMGGACGAHGGGEGCIQHFGWEA
jgi:hypothetical protein